MGDTPFHLPLHVPPPAPAPGIMNIIGVPLLRKDVYPGVPRAAPKTSPRGPHLMAWGLARKRRAFWASFWVVSPPHTPYS